MEQEDSCWYVKGSFGSWYKAPSSFEALMLYADYGYKIMLASCLEEVMEY